LVNTALSGQVLAYSLNLVQPVHYVVGDELLATFEEVESELNGLRPERRFWMAGQDTLQDPGTAPAGWQNLPRLASGASADNLPQTAQGRMKDDCFYIHTSGTTALPKASLMSHGKCIKACDGFGHTGLGLTEQDVLYLTLPCSHNNAVT